MEWYRVYHGMPEDAKLQVIAKRTSQPMAHVVSVWGCLLDAASKHDPRGKIQIDPEQIAVVQDILTICAGTKVAHFMANLLRGINFTEILKSYSRVSRHHQQ